jgi:uncharacterized protein YbaP (TraB family)
MNRFLSIGQKLILAAVLALLGATPGYANHRIQMTPAHPALWTVRGRQGTAYLFGSIHVLPPNIDWKTPRLLSVMRRSDIFVFEIPLDRPAEDREEARRIQKEIMDLHGLLPPGQSLRGILPSPLVSQYDVALARLSISPGYVDRLQPWLAAMVLETAQLRHTDAQAMAGVDVQVYAIASHLKKQTQGFETLEQQLAMVTPEEQSAGMDELGSTLGEAVHGGEERKYGALVGAWQRGDVRTLEAIAVSSLSKNPSLKKSLLDDRNARWVAQLRVMLDTPRTYFVTVGAAHLAGSGGVPALLRAAGYRVDGP